MPADFQSYSLSGSVVNL